MSTNTTVHIPILLPEITQALQTPFAAGFAGAYVDCTFGGGGHMAAMLQALAPFPQAHCIGIDRDQEALARGRVRFASEIEAGRLSLRHGDFAAVIENWDGPPIGACLADLGFSSDQIDTPERGLSFSKDGPLDMRLDGSQGQTAQFFLQTSPEVEIARVIHEYGEDRFARKIARVIVDRRRLGGVPNSTATLAEWVRAAYPGPARHTGRIHPATRTFQALRIHVNDELGQLNRLIDGLFARTTPGARVAFLTFHSLEDRIVKHAFKGHPIWEPLTKKPTEAGEAEVDRNPRSRSAKLRVYDRRG
jgi:16S rRNA (cytosine1402-N4)-methyltransferase